MEQFNRNVAVVTGASKRIGAAIPENRCPNELSAGAGSSVPRTSIHRVKADGVRVFYRAAGDNNTPVVLLLHVLAGHAYGGAAIATTREDRVKALVYIAALAPDESETVAEVFYRDEPNPNAPKLSPDVHGILWMPAQGFHQAVAHKAPSEQKNILFAVQRPISVECIEEPAPTPAWKAKPSWFLIAEEDPMINPKTQRFMADRMRASIRSERVDHSPIYTAPDLVIEVILEASRRTFPQSEVSGEQTARVQ